MKIAVAGGTGLVGGLVVRAAEEQGHDVVVLARSRGTDLATGSGPNDALAATLAGVLAGVETVIDVSNTTTTSAKASTAFFSTVTANLLAAEQASDVRHHLALSIVGVDRAPTGYYAGKRAQEQRIEDAPLPWTIMRATQFHEFVAQVYDSAKVGPLHIAPKMRTQPVAAREVAERLVGLACGDPAGFVADFGGPREESLVEMVRAYARARGSNAWIPALPLPGAFGRAQRDGRLLPGPDAERGVQTFAEWLAEL
jgi:uncharacterized protein YbjT (DUF2867 family)